MPIETTNSLLAGLIKCNLPIHVVQEVIINHDKDGAYAKFLSGDSLSVRKALVQRIPALESLKDWTKDGKV